MKAPYPMVYLDVIRALKRLCVPAIGGKHCKLAQGLRKKLLKEGFHLSLAKEIEKFLLATASAAGEGDASGD